MDIENGTIAEAEPSNIDKTLDYKENAKDVTKQHKIDKRKLRVSSLFSGHFAKLS